MASEESSGSRVATFFLLSLTVMFLAACCCCCCGPFFVTPVVVERAAALVVEDQPMDIAQAPAVAMSRDGISEKIRAEAPKGGEVIFSAEELNGVLQARLGTRAGRAGSFRIDGDHAALDLVIPQGEDAYLNIEVHGRAQMADGAFERLVIDRLRVGKLDLGGWLGGQDLSARVNRRLARQRRTDPDLDAQLATIERLEIRDGKVFLTVAPGDGG